MLGAMFGTTLARLAYKKHFDATDDADSKLAVFWHNTQYKKLLYNLITEIIGTYILALAVLYMAEPEVGLGALECPPVALVIPGIGLSLGGPTGYAINPARDLGPRIMHFILPIKNKRDSDWKYSGFQYRTCYQALLAIMYNIFAARNPFKILIGRVLSPNPNSGAKYRASGNGIHQQCDTCFRTGCT